MATNWHAARARFDRQIVPALARDFWRADAGSLRFISADYNIVYRFESDRRGHYLRICHSSLHPLPKARQVMAFLRYLAAEDVPVGMPAPSVTGKFIETLGQGYYASAQHEAAGVLMERHARDIAVYEAWGESLGKLHAASRRFQPDPSIDYDYPTVQRFWRNIATTVAKATPDLQRVYAELTDWMNGLPRQDYGLTHGDYRPGNVVWGGRVAKTIDFDEPNYHWYIADVARALLELWDEPLEARICFRERFMRGYSRFHNIDPWWQKQLPFFVQHRALLMHAWDVQEGGAWNDAKRWALGRVGW